MKHFRILIGALVFACAVQGGTGFSRLTLEGNLLSPDFVSVQAGGSVLIAGGVHHRSADNLSSITGFLVRLTPQGKLDPTFGKQGWVLVPHLVRGFQLLPDGKLLLSGMFSRRDPRAYGYWLTKLKADGQVDPSFGNAGEVQVDFGPGEEAPSSMLIGANGNITLVGLSMRGAWGEDTSYQMFTAVRLLPDGRRDTSFGDGGLIFERAFGVSSSRAYFFQRADGGFQMVGQPDVWKRNALTSTNVLNTAGFSAQGKMDRPYRIWNDMGEVYLGAATHLPDGSILVAGDYRTGTGVSGWMRKLQPNGEWDSSFGAKGHIGVAMAPRAVLLTADRKILMAGMGGSLAAVAVSRFTGNGKVDSTFGNAGTVGETIAQGTVGGASSQIAVDPITHKFYVVTTNGADWDLHQWAAARTQDLVVLRWTSDAVLDQGSFGP